MIGSEETAKRSSTSEASKQSHQWQAVAYHAQLTIQLEGKKLIMTLWDSLGTRNMKPVLARTALHAMVLWPLLIFATVAVTPLHVSGVPFSVHIRPIPVQLTRTCKCSSSSGASLLPLSTASSSSSTSSSSSSSSSPGNCWGLLGLLLGLALRKPT